MSSKLLRGIAKHVQGLIPIYQFAQSQLQWRRVAGLLAEGITQDISRKQTNLEHLFSFLDQVFEEFEQAKSTMVDLVVSNMTRTFVFDTLYDPIVLAHRAMDQAIFEDSNVSRQVLRFVNAFAHQQKTARVEFNEYSLAALPEFRKSKYDSLRVKSIRLFHSLLRVVRLYDDLLALDSCVPSRMFKNDEFVNCRFELLPMVLGQLDMYMHLLYGPDNCTIALLRQTAVLRNDLDIAEYYYVKNSEGKLVGQSSAAGRLSSPEAVRASGMWSFNLVFNIFSRPFLRKFLLGDEARKLFVMDSVADESVLFRKERTPIEVLAFDTVSLLASLEAEILVADVQDLLLKVLSNPTNQSWCHVFNGNGQQKRWAKDRARKYCKMVVRFQQSFAETELESSLCQRKASVTYLMEKLHESIAMSRKLPFGLERDIAQTRSAEKLVEASKYIKQWTREEIQAIGTHLIQLECAAEAVASFFHKGTGGAFPDIHTVVNPKWNLCDWIALRDGVFSSESHDAIRDVHYVRAILEGFVKATI
jgi:hypothetical protein